MWKVSRIVLLLSILLVNKSSAQSEVFGVPVNANSIAGPVQKAYDSLLHTHPQLSNPSVFSSLSDERVIDDKTPDFYLLIILIMLLGLIRLVDPRYFNNMWYSFRSPSRVSRQVREQMSAASIPSILMNVFFVVSAGAYAYYLVKIFVPYDTHNIPRYLLIFMLIGGLSIIYTAKYSMVKFSGWAFKLQGITEYYIFNILLINKVIAVALVPFTLILAFASPAWHEPAAIVSIALVAMLIINRYTRSWQVFGSFFQYSKFHFFTYLCASELLPLAVLIKLLIRGLVWK